MVEGRYINSNASSACSIRKLNDGWGKLWNLIICFIVGGLGCFNTQIVNRAQ